MPVKPIHAKYDWSKQGERERTVELLDTKIITIANTEHLSFVDNLQKLIEIVLDKN